MEEKVVFSLATITNKILFCEMICYVEKCEKFEIVVTKIFPFLAKVVMCVILSYCDDEM